MEHKLTSLAERLQAAFGDRLISAILYGSAAVGDFQEHRSDLNVLCVLTKVTLSELAEAEPIFRWWRELGNPAPLLMSAEEVRRSQDCFPMEFHDIHSHRRLLAGIDVMDDIKIQPQYYRAQVEHELRSKQLRLRQKGAESLSTPDHLLKLMTESVSTFCVLGRHAIILGGSEPKWHKREIVAGLETILGPLDGFKTILDVRANGKLPAGTTAVTLFDKYLAEIDRLVDYVDHIER